MKKFINNLKREIEANPVVAIAIGAAVITAAAKLMDANTARVSSRTHALEVNRRIANSLR